MNPVLVFQTEGPLPLLEDRILSISNVLSLGNHSRHTRYAGCFGLLHCHHVPTGNLAHIALSRELSSSWGPAGIGRASHRNHTWILLKCKYGLVDLGESPRAAFLISPGGASAPSPCATLWVATVRSLVLNSNCTLEPAQVLLIKETVQGVTKPPRRS